MYAGRRAPLPVVIRDELGELFAYAEFSAAFAKPSGAHRAAHRGGWRWSRRCRWPRTSPTSKAAEAVRDKISWKYALGERRRSVLICWYARAGTATADITEHRKRRPWYTTKRHASLDDMLIAFRRARITGHLPSSRHPPTNPDRGHDLHPRSRIVRKFS
jgi:hypothetical protein